MTGQFVCVIMDGSDISLSNTRNYLKHLHGNIAIFKSCLLHMLVSKVATPRYLRSPGFTPVSSLLSDVSTNTLPYIVAKTGELTLTGMAFCIRRVPEKEISATFSCLHTIIVPVGNRNDSHD